jgi:uncharacterized protein YbbK (DUF523 family)
MENLYTEKIKIGMSSCMYGARVRYNSKGWEMLGYLHRERSNYLWTPVCPEVMSGMGVPRSPIRLVGGNGEDFWVGNAKVKNREGRDVTSMVGKGALACYETLERAEVDAYIFMEGSPSCGVYRTTLKNQRLGKPPGIFGALLLNRGYFLIPAQDLQSPVKWWDWRRRLTAFVWLKRQEVTQVKDLYEIWHILKFLCQELDEKSARELGHRIGSFKKDVGEKVVAEVKDEILEILRKPSDVKRVKQWLWKNYIHLKKSKGISIEDVCPPEALRNMTHIAEEMIHVEIESRDKGLIFGSSPINYKPSR